MANSEVTGSLKAKIANAKYLRFTIVVMAAVAVDQISKGAVLKYMALYKSIPVIPGFFSITHVHNPGGAFGFLAQNAAPWRHWLFLVAVVLALGMILYFHLPPSFWAITSSTFCVILRRVIC